MARRAKNENPNESSPISAEVEAAMTKRRAQRPFPASTFEEPLNFAKAIFQFGGGQSVKRLTLLDQLGKSPESSGSRQLIINSGRYGLTRGGVQAENIELTIEGQKAVDEQISPRERTKIRAELAILNIEVFEKLYHKFLGNKLPAHAALIDAAKDAGVDSTIAAEAVDTFIVNLRFVGLLKTLSGAERIISIDSLLSELPASPPTPYNQPIITKSQSTRIITSEQAQFESTCFYIAPIGETGSEPRKHSDLFFRHYRRARVGTFQAESRPRRRNRQARSYYTSNNRIHNEIQTCCCRPIIPQSKRLL